MSADYHTERWMDRLREFFGLNVSAYELERRSTYAREHGWPPVPGNPHPAPPPPEPPSDDR